MTEIRVSDRPLDNKIDPSAQQRFESFREAQVIVEIARARLEADEEIEVIAFLIKPLPRRRPENFQPRDAKPPSKRGDGVVVRS